MRVLSRLFRRLFLEALQEASTPGSCTSPARSTPSPIESGFTAHLHPTRHTDWVVDATPPFAGPHQVLDCVGRYTHRVAISNQRLINIDDGHGQFRYKDYRASSTPQTMTLGAPEFMRRFLLHVLPAGFHRMRHDGLLGTRHRTHQPARCRQLLGTTAAPPIAAMADNTLPPPDYRDRYESLTGVSLRACPVCADGHMIVTECVPRARPYPAFPDTS